MTVPFKALQPFEPRVVDLPYAALPLTCAGDITDQSDATDQTDSSDVTDGGLVI